MSKTQTPWLKSPVSALGECLKPMRLIDITPMKGPARRMKLVRTQYIIGNDADADIQIKDPFISPRHAELVQPPGETGYLIRDLNSRNGVYLNGVRVQHAPLPAEGSLRLGRSTLIWAKEEVQASAESSCIAEDPAMREILAGLKRVADTSLPVLLLGETGTGKDVLARLLHQGSSRRDAPYVAVNGALTGGSLAESELFGHKKGAFTGADTHRLGALRSAHGGTLFLDEVADIPASAQVKLLRALESGELRALGSDATEKSQFRLVSATSQNIEMRVEEGYFRADLFFRLAGHVVVVPPLRARPLDILAMAKRWLNEAELQLDSDAEAKLLSYPWPGNVRELKACVERARVHAKAEGCPTVLPRHVSGIGRSGMLLTKGEAKGAPRTLEAVERDCVLTALERNGWSRLAASKELGIARSTLFEKMKRYGLRDRALLTG